MALLGNIWFFFLFLLRLKLEGKSIKLNWDGCTKGSGYEAVSLQEVEAESKINVWSGTVPNNMFLRKKIIGSICAADGWG